MREDKHKIDRVTRVTRIKAPLTVNDNGRSQCLVLRVRDCKFIWTNNIYTMLRSNF